MIKRIRLCLLKISYNISWLIENNVEQLKKNKSEDKNYKELAEGFIEM